MFHKKKDNVSKMMPFDWLAFIMLSLGGIVAGVAGVFNFNLLSALFDKTPFLVRLVYGLVSLSTIYLVWSMVKNKAFMWIDEAFEWVMLGTMVFSGIFWLLVLFNINLIDMVLFKSVPIVGFGIYGLVGFAGLYGLYFAFKNIMKAN